MSKIEWTEKTWNPITGCTKVSSGCANCYAERMALRLQRMGQPKYQDGFSLTIHEDEFDAPLQVKRPTMWFVCSMSDLMHPRIPTETISQLLNIMSLARWHTFQVLTKRAERLREFYPWPSNIWLGVSVEDARSIWRLDRLREVEATVRFISFEPLLDSVTTADLTDIDWVIVGGESGPGSRPMNPDWVRDIRDRCVRAGIPFFFKQWGGANKKEAGRELDGRTWDEIPETRKR